MGTAAGQTPLAAWSTRVVHNACAVFWSCLVFFLLISVIGVVGLMDSTIDAGNSYFSIQGSEVAQRQFARDRRWQSDHSRRELQRGQRTALQLTLLYETRDGSSLLTPEGLAEMKAAESALLRNFVRDFDVAPPTNNMNTHGMPTVRGGACGLQLSGVECANGYGTSPGDQNYRINQLYVAAGSTASGAQYYCGVDRSEICLFHDQSCGGMSPAWVLGCTPPDASRTSDLQGGEAGNCCNSANIQTSDSSTPPLGTSDRWWAWCGESSASGSMRITITDTCDDAPLNPPSPPAPPPMVRGTAEYAVTAALALPPQSLARVFFDKGTSGEWHYTDAPLGGVAFETRLAELASHVAETALAPAGSSTRGYCADPSDPSTCLDDLRGHFETEFSPCAPFSNVTATHLAFTAGALGEAAHDEGRVISWLNEQMDLLHADSGPMDLLRVAWTADLNHQSLRASDENTTVVYDALWVGSALVLVLVLLLCQLRVVFTAMLGWLQILLCFPSAMFIYRYLLGVRYVGILNFMTLFVVFGIGADDIFVFDAYWRRSAVLIRRADHPSDTAYLAARMRYALPHAAATMFATSLTTMMAFFANAISLVPPIRLFGIFAGLMVLALYLMVIVWLPAAFAIHAAWGLAGRARTAERANLNNATSSAQDAPRVSATRASANGATDQAAAPTPQPRISALSMWLRDTWASWLWHASPIVLPLMSVFFAVCVVLMMHIQPASQNPDLWPSEHNHVRAAQATQRLGAAQTYPLPVEIIYGLTPGDTRGLDPTSSEDCWSQPGGCPSFWDPTFDAMSEAGQAHLLETCDLLLSDPTSVRNFPSLECPLYSWRDYLTNRGEAFPASASVVARHLASWAQTVSWPDSDHIRYERGRLRWLRIRAYSTMNTGMGPVELAAHYRTWEAFMNARNAAAPIGLRGGFQFSDMYMLMDTLLNLVSTGFTSTLLSCILALIVLLIFTGDLLVASLAFLSVALIVSTVLGTMVLTGQSMGVVESIVLAVLVGMSVDYVVHLGVAFVDVDVALGTRGRTAEALGKMGQPILSGALTTSLTAASLFLPQMVTFHTFGRFIVSIVICSAVQAMVYFPMLLMHFGPRTTAFRLSLPALVARAAAAAGYHRESRQAVQPGIAMASSSADASCSSAGAPVVATSEVIATEKGRGESVAAADALAAAEATRVIAAAEAAEKQPAWWRSSTLATAMSMVLGLLLLGIYAAGGVVASTSAQAVAVEDAPTCAAEGLLNLTFRPYGIRARADDYVCQPMQLPTDCEYHVTRMAPIATSEYLHHMILFGVLEELTPHCTVGCFDMPGQVVTLWAWAVGGGAWDLPPNVGLRLGRGTSYELATLQMHYNNPAHDTNMVDASGVQLTLTRQMRQYDMGIVFGGAPTTELLRIPPRQRAFTVRVDAPIKLASTVSAFASGLHAHQAGVDIQAWLLRGGVTIATLGTESPYDFNYQRFRNLAPEVELRPGDVMRIQCTYNTMARSTCTYGGDGSQDEMCLAFLSVYPANAVSQSVSITSAFTQRMSDPLAAWQAVRPNQQVAWPVWLDQPGSGDAWNASSPPSSPPDATGGWYSATAVGYNPC